MAEHVEIPSAWTWCTLGDGCIFFQGYGFPKYLQGQSKGEYPFYKVGDISKNVQAGNSYLEFCENYISEDILKELKAKVSPKNTIVFAKIGEALKLNRRALIKNPGIVDNNAIGLKAYDKIYSDLFLFYFLTCLKLENYSRATTVPSVRKTDIENIEVPLPPLPEQHRIVAKIEELFSSLDKGIESLKTAQQQLKVYRQAVLKWAFEGVLTGSNGKDKKYSRLEEICDFITKGTTPLKGNLFQGIGEVPFIKVYNLTFSGKLDFSIDPTFVTNETHNGFLARSKVLPGDVLMNIVGPPLGKVSIVPEDYPEWNINQAIARFRCNKLLYNKFLAFFLMANFNLQQMIHKSKATAGQFNLTLEICRDIEIPIHFSIEEQQAIIAEIESRLSVCDKIEDTIEQGLKQAEALRQSILKKAFEGRLVPQDPDDEPASVLLERIRKEREKVPGLQKKTRSRT